MSNETYSNRNIRQRCRLKYCKSGKFYREKEKWVEYDCVFTSSNDAHHGQQYHLELYDEENVHLPNGKMIDLRDLKALTYLHGNPSKNEPKEIILLQFDRRKHRLGFDNDQEYKQWKVLLDGVYSSAFDRMKKTTSDENTSVNMLYESATAISYNARLADTSTRNILQLSDDRCVLVVDTDKVVLEQNHDKQYTFPRSTIRSISLKSDNEIEFVLGTHAPVQGAISFRFVTPMEAKACHAQWSPDCVPAIESESPAIRMRSSVRRIPEPPPNEGDETRPQPPPRKPTPQKKESAALPPPPIAPPRSTASTKNYYSNGPLVESSEPAAGEYTSFTTSM